MSRYYGFSEPSRRAGLRARSKRGDIGETWWSRRFVSALEGLAMGGRLARGRSYARHGNVLDLSVEAGVVRASVQGSRARPYRLSISLKPLTAKQWDALEEAMAARALLAAKLLAGEMPPEIEEVFERCGASLFPESRRALVTRCSCPDYENPCKHIAAAFYILAEKFDDDPFLIFAWRGRTKEDLLAGLRERRGVARRRTRVRPAATSGGAPPLQSCIETFWEAGRELAPLQIDPRAAPAPDALLEELGPLPAEAGKAAATGMLTEAYRTMAETAEVRAWEGAPIRSRAREI